MLPHLRLSQTQAQAAGHPHYQTPLSLDGSEGRIPVVLEYIDLVSMEGMEEDEEWGGGGEKDAREARW